MPTLFIHIGPHKTGTTSIQRCLKDHIGDLKAQSVCVYQDAHAQRLSTNAFALAHAVIDDALLTPLRLKHYEFPDSAVLARHAAAEIAAAEGRDLVVSAEAFSFLRSPDELFRLMGYLSGPFDRTRTIIVARNRSDRSASWIAQCKRMSIYETIMALPSQEDGVLGDWYFDDARRARLWSRVGEVQTIDYAQEVDGRGSILPAILDALGVSLPSVAYWRNRTPARRE